MVGLVFAGGHSPVTALAGRGAGSADGAACPRSRTAVAPRPEASEDSATMLTGWAERARRGDQESLARLLTHEQPRLYATALALLGCRWRAQDATQEALTVACATVSRLREPERVRAWLGRILTTKAVDILRAEARYSGPETAPAQTDAGPGLAETVGGDLALREALLGLDPDRRIVVALRFFLDLNYAEIVDVTGLPPGTVRSRLHRALLQLHECLVGDAGEHG